MTVDEVAAAPTRACRRRLRALHHPATGEHRGQARLELDRAYTEWLLATEASPALSGHAGSVA